MADYEVGNKLPAAAAAASLPMSNDKAEEVSSPPLPATHDVVKQIKPPRPLLPAAAVLVDVATPPPASPAVVVPADEDDNYNETYPPADRVLNMVSLWATVHVAAFIVAIVIDDLAPCTSRTWLLPPCVALTDAAYAAVSALLHGEIWCIVAVALSALPVHKLLTGKTTTIRRMRGLWWAAAAADALAWVALAATAGLDCLQVATDRIYLATDPGKTYFFVSAVLASGCLTVDVVVAGFFLCHRRFPRRLSD